MEVMYIIGDLASMCQLCQISDFLFVGNKISGFNVMSAQNGVGCLLMLLLHPNGHASITHGTQNGNAILCSLLMCWAMCDPINL